MATFEANSEPAKEALSKEDYIAFELCGDNEDTLVIYYEEDRNSLSSRLKAQGFDKDAELMLSSTDPCARYSKRECDQAGGCCRWVTSGGFNFCKCI